MIRPASIRIAPARGGGGGSRTAGLGDALPRTDQPEAAIPPIRRAAAFGLGSVEAHAALVAALDATGRITEARRARERAVHMGYSIGECGRHAKGCRAGVAPRKGRIRRGGRAGKVVGGGVGHGGGRAYDGRRRRADGADVLRAGRQGVRDGARCGCTGLAGRQGYKGGPGGVAQLEGKHGLVGGWGCMARRQGGMDGQAGEYHADAEYDRARWSDVAKRAAAGVRAAAKYVWQSWPRPKNAAVEAEE